MWEREREGPDEQFELDLDRSGRCARFEAWPFWPEGSSGTYARAS